MVNCIDILIYILLDYSHIARRLYCNQKFVNSNIPHEILIIHLPCLTDVSLASRATNTRSLKYRRLTAAKKFCSLSRTADDVTSSWLKVHPTMGAAGRVSIGRIVPFFRLSILSLLLKHNILCYAYTWSESCLFFRAALLPIALNYVAMTAGTLKVHAI